jgi:hypothetical protein
VQISPELVLGVNFVLLMIILLTFGQSGRMYIHAVRSCPPPHLLAHSCCILSESESKRPTFCYRTSPSFEQKPV